VVDLPAPPFKETIPIIIVLYLYTITQNYINIFK